MKRLLVVVVMVVSGMVQLGVADTTVSYRARVVEVIDGDTLVVSNKVLIGDITLKGEAMVKLDGMHAPKMDQPGGQEAKAFLERLVKDKDVRVVELTDMGESRGAWVFISDEQKSVNAQVIEDGHAWLVKPRAISFPKLQEEYLKMGDIYRKAKDIKTGIWAFENPIPPWEWATQRKKEGK